MSTLVELNTYSTSTVSYTDNRPSGVVLTYPSARDVSRTILTQTTTLQRKIDIVEIVQPSIANIRFEVDVNDVVGATVDFGTLPSGLSLTQIGDTYTITGIDSISDWQSVRAPTITVPVDFFGSFNSTATIRYFDNNLSQDVDVSWTDGNYIPQALLESTASMSADITVIRNATANLLAFNTVLAIPQEYALISQFSLTASGDVYPIVVLPATAALSYSLNTDFTLQNTPLIHGPDEANMSMTITPSTPSALSTYATEGIGYAYNNDTINRNGNSMAISSNYSLVFDNLSSISGGMSATAVLTNLTTGVTNSHTSINITNNTDQIRGKNLAISDSYYAYGADHENISGLSVSGKVYVRNLSDNSLKYTLVNPQSDFGASDNFGKRIAMTDDYIVIWADFWAYVYDLSDGLLEYSIDGGSDQHGDVSINSTYFGVGDVIYNLSDGLQAYDLVTATSTANMNEDYIITTGNGQAKLWSLSTGSVVYTKNDPESEGSGIPLRYGWSSAITTDYFLVSDAHNEYVYQYSIDDGSLITTLSEETTNTGTQYGYAIASSNKLTYVAQVNHSNQTTHDDIEIYSTAEIIFNNTTKVLTLNGSKTAINTALNGEIDLTPATGYTSNFTLTYTGFNEDNDSMSQIQSVNYT